MAQFNIELAKYTGSIGKESLKNLSENLFPFLALLVLIFLGNLNQWIIWGAHGKFLRHLAWNIIGIVMFVGVVFFTNYSKIPNRIVFILYVLLCLILVLADLKGGGSVKQRRWIHFGSISIEPSEFLKPLLLILLSQIAASEGSEYLSVRRLAQCVALIVVPLLLVVVNDLDYSFIMGVMFFSFLLFIGIPKRILKVSLILLLVLTPIVVHVGWKRLKPHQKGRIYGYLYPEKYAKTWAYQLNQSLIAIGNGGLLGNGFKKGLTTRLRYLPAEDTDLAFSSWAEATGLLGVTLFFIFYGYLIWFSIKVSESAKDWLGRYMSLGIGLIFLWQFLFNVGGCSGLLPMTSIPLPFLSYGGSITISSYFLLSLLFNIALKRHFFK